MINFNNIKMAHWNCENTMEEVWTFINNFWKTEEGKQYFYKRDTDSCLKVVDGIKSMYGKNIFLCYIQGLINGYINSPKGAILHYIHTVSKCPRPTETFCEHAKLNFNLNLSIEEVEKILVELGSKNIRKIEIDNNEKNIEENEDDLKKKYIEACKDFGFGIINVDPGTFLNYKKNI